MNAYDAGRHDEEANTMDWIQRWSGTTNSALGSLLFERMQELFTVQQGQWVKKDGSPVDKSITVTIQK